MAKQRLHSPLIAKQMDLAEEQNTAQAKLRTSVFNAISEADVTDVVKSIVAKAKEGDSLSLKYLFDYILGGKVTTAVQNNYIIDGTKQPAPTESRAGTSDKVEVMRNRLANGEALFNGSDFKTTE